MHAVNGDKLPLYHPSSSFGRFLFVRASSSPLPKGEGKGEGVDVFSYFIPLTQPVSEKTFQRESGQRCGCSHKADSEKRDLFMTCYGIMEKRVQCVHSFPFRMTISIRLFLARPSGVPLSAIGRLRPKLLVPI